MPEDMSHEQPEKRKETRKSKKIIGNVSPPENPEKGQTRVPTFEHG